MMQIRCIQCDREVYHPPISSASSSSNSTRGWQGRGGDTSFVMVARMADMSMSNFHVQDAAFSGGRRGSDGLDIVQPGLSEHLRRAEMVLKYGTGKVCGGRMDLTLAFLVCSWGVYIYALFFGRYNLIQQHVRIAWMLCSNFSIKS